VATTVTGAAAAAEKPAAAAAAEQPTAAAEKPARAAGRPAAAAADKPVAAAEKPAAAGGKPVAAAGKPPAEKPPAAEKPDAGEKPDPAQKPDPAEKPGTAVARGKDDDEPDPPPAPGKRRPDAGELQERSEEASAPAASDLLGIPKRTRKQGASAPEPEGLPIPGGPLAIPGAEVDLRSKRVDRFMATGGADLEGRLVGVDDGKPVAGALVEAWMGTKSIHAASDEQGRFRFEGLVPSSRVTLWITATPTFVQERTEVAVPAQRPKFEAVFRLLPRAAVAGTQEGGVGLFLSRRGTRTVVTGLVAFGPGERAGLRVGDAIVAIGKRNVAELGPGAVEYLLRGPIGSEVTMTVQSTGSSPRTVKLTRSGR
jgi:hypothetical protein